MAQLQSVNGRLLKIEGFVTLSCKIGITEFTHGFYVSPSVNRNFILGRDWLVQKGLRLYFDLGILKFGDTTVPLRKTYILPLLCDWVQKQFLDLSQLLSVLAEFSEVVRYLLASCMQFQLYRKGLWEINLT